MISMLCMILYLTLRFTKVNGSSYSIENSLPYSSSQHQSTQTCPNSKLLSFHFHSLQETPLRTSEAEKYLANQTEEDSPTKDNLYHPWDSAPQCLNNDTTIYCRYVSSSFCDSDTTTYCIYTISSFSSNRGITLLTSPQTASQISNSIGFTSPKPSFPPLNHTNFYSAELSGRGIGLIANKTFNHGELILSTAPVLVLDESTFDDLPPYDRQHFQTKAVESLPGKSKELFFGLSGAFGGDEVEDRVRTNSFGATFAGKGESPGSWGVVVPEAARLNHDCRPNARFAFDPETLTHKVHAVRTIHPGEELTVSYIDERSPFSERQHHIRTHWGFTCTCAHCSLPPHLRAESDARIASLNSLRTALLDFAPTSTSTSIDARELIALYEEEGLQAVMAEAYMLAALRYAMWGDENGTREMARAAVERWLVWEKRGGRNREEMVGIAEEPRRAGVWGVKLRRKDEL